VFVGGPACEQTVSSEVTEEHDADLIRGEMGTESGDESDEVEQYIGVAEPGELISSSGSSIEMLMDEEPQEQSAGSQSSVEVLNDGEKEEEEVVKEDESRMIGDGGDGQEATGASQLLMSGSGAATELESLFDERDPDTEMAGDGDGKEFFGVSQLEALFSGTETALESLRTEEGEDDAVSAMNELEVESIGIAEAFETSEKPVSDDKVDDDDDDEVCAASRRQSCDSNIDVSPAQLKDTSATAAVAAEHG